MNMLRNELGTRLSMHQEEESQSGEFARRRDSWLSVPVPCSRSHRISRTSARRALLRSLASFHLKVPSYSLQGIYVYSVSYIPKQP